VGGVGRVYDGQLVRSDDPIVKGRLHLFDDVDDVLGIVEQATKNPGQKRTAKRRAPVEPDVETPEITVEPPEED
jgi:hypothetical protein